MVEFSKRLASKGVRVTIVIPTVSAATKSMKQLLAAQPNNSSFKVELISDGSEHLQKLETAEEQSERFRRVITRNLSNLITNINKNASVDSDNSEDDSDNDDYPLKCIVYHSCMPWVLDIARQHGLDEAPFFTCSSAATAIFYQFYEGVLKIPSKHARTSSTTMLLPSMHAPLGFNDLPSFLSDVDAYPTNLKVSLSQFFNIAQVKWIFCSNFAYLAPYRYSSHLARAHVCMRVMNDILRLFMGSLGEIK
jgi:hypothetical protein